MKKHLRVIACALLASCTTLASAQSTQAPVQELQHVTGDVYRFRNNFHYSLVVITDEGVVVVDPINAAAATRLEQELTTLTDKPVSHLIYSHSHLDHASGGSVFTDTAKVIAQENAPGAIDGVVPDERFADTATLELGGKTLELTYLGPGHGIDMIAVVVRPENVAFITDVAAPNRLPYRAFDGASNIDDWIEQLRRVEALDFDVLAPAHGELGDKSDATAVRIYIETLRAQVLEGLRTGKTPEDLTAELTLDDYRDWAQYEQWRAENIQGMAKYLLDSGEVKQ